MSIAEYKTWLAAKAAKVAEGGVSEYIEWFEMHPSPMVTGLFGRTLSRPELFAKAVESAAHAFKGTNVEVRHAHESQPSGWDNLTSGQLGGLGYVVEGNRQINAVALLTEFSIVMIPVRSILEMDNVI